MVKYAMHLVLVMLAASLLFFACSGEKLEVAPGDQKAVDSKALAQSLAVQCSDVSTIAEGTYHTVGLKKDGTVVAVGSNSRGQLNISSWTNIKAIAAGTYHTVGLKEDGTVVAVGDNGRGQLNVSSWTNIKAIAAGTYHTIGLKDDGTVVAVGYNANGQLNVSSWSNIQAVAGGSYHTVGLKKDGTVVSVGNNSYGQLNVSTWTNIKAITAGWYHTVGLKDDGTVLAAGFADYGQLNVSSWTNIKAIAAGMYHTVGLSEDRTVVATGNNSYGQLNVTSWTNMKAIAAGGNQTAGLKDDGTVMAVGSNGNNQLAVSSLTNIMPICDSAPVDAVPPVTTALVTGTSGSNGWYISDVRMTLTATDNDGGSGVKEIHYTADGVETVIAGSSASLPVAGDGTHLVTWYAVDITGNMELPAKQMTINIDKTPPSIFSFFADPAILWPSNHKMIDVHVQGAATDSGSGVESTTITVTDEYGVCNVTVPDFGSTISLESWRNGGDKNGRLYTITAVATDKAGNQSTGTTTVLVPHDMR